MCSVDVDHIPSNGPRNFIYDTEQYGVMPCPSAMGESRA